MSNVLESYDMRKLSMISLLLTWLLLGSGCGSVSPVPVVPLPACQPEPPVPAWMMEPSTPNFTQRLRQILPVLQQMPTSVQ
ncbi:hypothetical protein AAA552_02310 [Pseudomonas aeruginosa]|nr:hypothetical protein [Pseudomonas aeruginosa]ERY75426.1 hypothetical protein Q029_02257 [Pseudomonas aeruginosa BWHPSA016]ETD46651.1 hypothetical protein X922_17365 [Pseudomonas aeruginosa VRFPA08]MCG0480620.1 hypothetical protein [Pseudomonas aeruginosa]MCM8606474.1 hypothetical protein [Pseudomonas aeruginosa]MCM8647880.1 hypothetical protein [Pseudomonas aeruginosa]